MYIRSCQDGQCIQQGGKLENVVCSSVNADEDYQQDAQSLKAQSSVNADKDYQQVAQVFKAQPTRLMA